MTARPYLQQVDLLLRVLPAVATEECFALKGGTAINLFVRDMPRLSVDIDLTYLPLDTRQTALANIQAALTRIGQVITRTVAGVTVTAGGIAKLTCQLHRAAVKIEVNTTLRGTLGEPRHLTVCPQAQDHFHKFAAIQVLPLGELFGGKLCAALDRQHPRDLFDVKYLLDNEGLTPAIRRGLLMSLLSHDRPIHELLRPNLKDQRRVITHQFAGLTTVPFDYAAFERVRQQLIDNVNASLDDNDRAFLQSFKAGDPDWQTYGFVDFEPLPAVQWKLQNIRKLKRQNPAKHAEQYDKLKRQLD